MGRFSKDFNLPKCCQQVALSPELIAPDDVDRALGQVVNVLTQSVIPRVELLNDPERSIELVLSGGHEMITHHIERAVAGLGITRPKDHEFPSAAAALLVWGNTFSGTSDGDRIPAKIQLARVIEQDPRTHNILVSTVDVAQLQFDKRLDKPENCQVIERQVWSGASVVLPLKKQPPTLLSRLVVALHSRP